MAPPAYSKRLYGGIPSTARTTVSVPVGRRWVVRDISCVGSHAAWVLISVGGVGYLAAVRCDLVQTQAVGRWQGYAVVHSGELLSIDLDPAGGFYVYISGYEFVD